MADNQDVPQKKTPVLRDPWMGLPRSAVLGLVGLLALLNLGRHLGDPMASRQIQASWVAFTTSFSGVSPAWALARIALQPHLAKAGKTLADVEKIQPPPAVTANDPGSSAPEPIRLLYAKAQAEWRARDQAMDKARQDFAKVLGVKPEALILPDRRRRYTAVTAEYEARKNQLVAMAANAAGDDKVTFEDVLGVQPPDELAAVEGTDPETKALVAAAKAAHAELDGQRAAARGKLATQLGASPDLLVLPEERRDHGRGVVGRLADYVFGAEYWPFLRAAGHFAFVLPVVYSSLPLFGGMVVLFLLAWALGGTWHPAFMLAAMMSPLLDMIFLQDIPPLMKGQSLGADAWRRIRKDRFAMACLAVIWFYACVALLCRIEVLATGEGEPVSVVRGAWVEGQWQEAYVFKAGSDLPPDLEPQAPTLEYQAPSLMTRFELGWVRTFGSRNDLRQMLELGPVPTNQQLEEQVQAYRTAKASGASELPAIMIPNGNYDAPGPDGLYPDERNAIPGWFDYPLGTDFLARDVFKRVLHGTRIAMSVGLVSCVIAIPIGTFFGSLAGFYGGFVDEMIVLLYSTVASVPGLLLLLAFVMVVGKGVIGVYIALGMTSWVSLCRLVRGEFIKHKEREYVVAARSLGATNFSCIFKHILPNVFHILIINFSLRFVYAVQSEVILSYLGVGVNDQPSWGVMINDAKLELARGVWWQLAAATMAMFVIVLALNIFGDILRDALDPKLRE